MEMKHRTGEGWETLYPKTLADNVKLNSGLSVQDKFNEVDDKFPEEIILWEGMSQLGEDDEVTPSKLLSDCANGWILVWRKESSNQQYQYTIVPKISLTFVGGGGARAVLADTGNIMVHKYFYPRDDKITGHFSNVDGENNRIVLYRVLEF